MKREMILKLIETRCDEIINDQNECHDTYPDIESALEMRVWGWGKKFFISTNTCPLTPAYVDSNQSNASKMSWH